MKKSILAMGWFGQGNLGDEAFKQSYLDLWGKHADFTFCPFGQVPKNLNEFDACFVGGGSFLDQPVPVLDKIKIPLGFIGVGIHDFVHKANFPALKAAKIIVSRNSGFDFPLETFTASDLVFARDLSNSVSGVHFESTKTLLVLGNDFLLARRDLPHWKNVWFHTFVNELAGILDDLVEENWRVHFYPMQTPTDSHRVGAHDDRLFAAHIVSQMKTRSSIKFHWGAANEPELLRRMKEASMVVSMRFHGNVFSTILGKPFVGIISHDKMKAYFGSLGVSNFLDYYGFTKNQFRDRVSNHSAGHDYLLSVAEKERLKWLSMSDIVAERFGL